MGNRAGLRPTATSQQKSTARPGPGPQPQVSASTPLWGLGSEQQPGHPLLLRKWPVSAPRSPRPRCQESPAGAASGGIFIADMQKSCHPHLFTQQGSSPGHSQPRQPQTDPRGRLIYFFPPHLILHHPSFQNKLPQTSRAPSGPGSLPESPLQPPPPLRLVQSHGAQPGPSAAFGLDLEAAAPDPAGF